MANVYKICEIGDSCLLKDAYGAKRPLDAFPFGESALKALMEPLGERKRLSGYELWHLPKGAYLVTFLSGEGKINDRHYLKGDRFVLKDLGSVTLDGVGEYVIKEIKE